MKKKPAQLKLTRETLRILQVSDTARVAGGGTASDYVNSCYPNYCYVDTDPCP
jgi:hypothetical protein